MIAIDEPSATKLQENLLAVSNPPNPPTWWKDVQSKGWLTAVKKVADFQKELGDPANLDPESLIGRISNVNKTLSTPPMNYRVFTTDVILRNSKWSK